MGQTRNQLSVYVILLACCGLLMFAMTACESNVQLTKQTEGNITTASVPDDLPEYLSVFRPELEQGYAVFNASGYGIVNRQAVADFFLSEPNDRATFLGVIAYGQGGEPYLYEITGLEGAYTVTLDSTRDPFGKQEIRSYTYEHTGVLAGKVTGQACVLYNGGMPDLDNPEDWLPEKAMPIVNLREEQP